MVKRHSIGFLRRVTWLTIALIAFTSVGICYETHRVCDKIIYTIFKNKFIEPVENLYLLTYDWTLYKLTSQHERYVDFEMEELKRALKKNGHEISDIMLIIHNHPPTAPRGFSRADVQTWYEFKMEGFSGNFYLFISMTTVIFELREDKK